MTHGGTNAKRHRMRCIDCFNKMRRTHQGFCGRFTIKRLTTRCIRCPYCGGENIKSVEQERRREVQHQDTCHCAPIPFPHRKGSILLESDYMYAVHTKRILNK